MKNATIVFDLDGTLIDTAPDLINATNYVMKHAGFPTVDNQTARPWISFGARHMIVQALDHTDANLTDPQIDNLLELFLEHYAANIARESRPYPAMLETLESLAHQGARLAVCTNKREGLACALLDELKLSGMFHAIVGRDTLPTCKPDPRHILGTIEMAKGTSNRAIMVGDSDNDIKAAKAAKIPSIAVTFGYSKIPASKLGANRVIDHYRDLEPALRALLAI